MRKPPLFPDGLRMHFRSGLSCRNCMGGKPAHIAPLPTMEMHQAATQITAGRVTRLAMCLGQRRATWRFPVLAHTNGREPPVRCAAPGCVRQRRSVGGFHSEETSEFDHTTATRQDKTARQDSHYSVKLLVSASAKADATRTLSAQGAPLQVNGVEALIFSVLHQKCFDIFGDIFRLGIRSIAFDNLPTTIDQKLGKVPFDPFCSKNSGCGFF
jgi:hypothetical protein